MAPLLLAAAVPLRTVCIGYGWLPGDWRDNHETAKTLHMIEPVSEGVMQFFCQTIILYIIAGPGESRKFSEKSIDLSSLAFDSSLSSKLLYLLLLSSSLTTLCSSLARVKAEALLTTDQPALYITTV